MQLRHIVAAADESDAGRQAVRTAVELASRCSARVTVLRVVVGPAVPRFAGVAQGTVVLAGPMISDEYPESERLYRWLRADVISGDQTELVEPGVAHGIPSIEICRFSEDRAADLVVLGRKRPGSSLL